MTVRAHTTLAFKRAQRFAEEFARYDALLEAARLLEQLASTRKPVLAQRG